MARLAANSEIIIKTKNLQTKFIHMNGNKSSVHRPAKNDDVPLGKMD